MWGGYYEPEKKMRESDLDGWGMPLTYSNVDRGANVFSYDKMMMAHAEALRTLDRYGSPMRVPSFPMPRYEGGTITKMNKPEERVMYGYDVAAGADNTMFVRHISNGTTEIGWREDPRVDEEKDVEPVERPSNSNRAIRNMFMRKRKENNLTAHQVIS